MNPHELAPEEDRGGHESGDQRLDDQTALNRGRCRRGRIPWTTPSEGMIAKAQRANWATSKEDDSTGAHRFDLADGQAGG